MDFTNNFFTFKTYKHDIPDEILKSNILSGTISKIIYYNIENNFLIAKFKISSSSIEIIIKGNIVEPCEGIQLKINGFWDTDKIYGIQFDFTEFETIEPTDKKAIINYLGSGLIKNIGKITAKKIVDYFGRDTLNIIENYPYRLTEVPGIGKKKKEDVVKGYSAHLEVKKIMIFLAKNNISSKFGFKLYSIYKQDTIHTLEQNPYILIKDIKGVGFLKADKIAEKLGTKPNDINRIMNVFFYILDQAANNEGHTYLPVSEFIYESYKLLKISKDDVNTALSKYKTYLKDYDIIIDDDRVYLLWNYFSEIGITESLKKIYTNRNILDEKFLNFNFDNIIYKIEQEINIKLSKNQYNTILECLKSKIFILTGGPGTGKTTITKFFVELFKHFNLKVKLCSPTGRAAKRLNELTGYDAYTIHRLLEYKPKLGFTKNEENKLNIDVLVIDEFSMVSLSLFYNLLKAVKKNTILIMVGDTNQLPSVGAGNLLQDLIQSEKINSKELIEIFRQSKNSNIVINAHNIINKKNIIINNTKKSDFFVIENNNKKQVLKEIIDLFNNRLPSYGFDKENIQILVPIYKSILGVNNINSEIQKNEIKNKTEYFEFGNSKYYLNNRIIQLKNNYDKNVMNGDIGKVIAIGDNKKSILL